MSKVITLASLVSFSGRGKTERAASFASIPSLAQGEAVARGDLIKAIRHTLGDAPVETAIAAVKLAVTVGRIAARLPVTDKRDNDAHLAHMLALVTQYAAPPVEGKAARKLRAGQLGRRTVTEHKAIRAADEAWSQLAAECGIGGAKTQGEKNKAKATRAAHHNTPKVTAAAPATQANVGEVAPSHDALLVAPSAMTADDAMAHIMQQATNLAAYGNKYAKVIPVDFGMALIQFKSAINKAMNDAAVRKATADAIKAEREK